MGWTGEILTGAGGFNKINVNGRGDLQRALGTSSWSQVYIFQNAYINPMAKYKAVALAGVYSGPLTDAQRQSVRYGMDTPPAFDPSRRDDNIVWKYKRPILGTHPFRPMDFIADLTSTDRGYDPAACSPLGFDLQEINIGAAFGIQLYLDNGVNAYYSNNKTSKRWYANRSLSCQELTTYDDLWNYSIGFTIYDKTSNAWNQIVTNKTLKQARESGSVVNFMLYPQGGTELGVTHPEIPILNESSRSGHEFLIVASLFTTTAVPSGQAYLVRTNNPTNTGYSLAFEADVDRKSAIAMSFDSIMGVTGSLVSGLTLTKVTEATFNGQRYAQYSLSANVKANITTPYSWKRMGVTVKLRAFNSAGYIGASPEVTGDVTYERWVQMNAIGSNSYTNVDLGDIESVWFLTAVPVQQRSIALSAVFSSGVESVNFSNSINVYASS